ncbi:MAG: GH116 family glycosyl-hydrolase, partial [Planctomycetota bacterium]|nr:GH116 family glycosyl-hydrolase [Planctomycetota bacterium]
MAERAIWPILTRYRGEYLRCVAMPLGGIGTGSVSLGGRGDLRDWEIVNRPAKGFAPRYTFFALYAKAGKAPAAVRVLEGEIPPPYAGAFGVGETMFGKNNVSGLPRFRHCEFCAAYPLAQVLLRDPDVPVDVRLEAWNPFIPCDAEASSMPLAVLR